MRLQNKSLQFWADAKKYEFMRSSTQSVYQEILTGMYVT